MPTINDRIGSQNIIRVLANASAPPTRINNLIDVVSTKKDETTADGYLLIWDRTTQKYNLGNDIAGGLNVQGISTFTSHVDLGEVNFSGVTTAPSFVATESIAMGATTVITAARQLQNIASLDATTTATIEAAVTNAPNTFTDLQITGLSTFLGASRFDSVATFNGGIHAPTGVATISSLNIADEITISEGGLDVSGVTSTANLYVTGVSTFYNADVVFQGAAAGQNMTWDASENDLEFSDDARLKFGNSDDLEIWHSGTSHIKNSTGDLKIRGDSIILKRADDSEKYIKATVNEDVKLYFNDSEKFATTNAGAVVTGIITATQIADTTGSVGSAASVLSSTGSGLSWVAQSGALQTRTTTTATTGSIAQAASTNITIPTAGKTFSLLKLAINAPAWVVLYIDSASRSSDASRTEGTDPAPGSGVITEVSTTTSGASTFNMTPAVLGWNNDGTPAAQVYAKVVNKRATSGSNTITVTLTNLALEA